MAPGVVPNGQPADWAHVARVVYRVEQRYQYTYTEPVRSLHHRLMVVPCDVHGDQRLLDHKLSIDGTIDEPTLEWDCDQFGNRVCTVRAGRVAQIVTFDATFRVERLAKDGDRSAWEAPAPAAELARWLEPTPLTTPDAYLRRVADGLRASSRWQRGRAYRAYHWAAAAITYRAGVTAYDTTAGAALAGGEGVCQDYAHILLTVLRLLDIPARYVSGHLLGEGTPHAWVEALFVDDTVPGGVRVVPYDPTNRAEPGLNYVTVAIGRDFADVTPTSGWFVGRASSELFCSKRADVVEVEYRDGARGQFG
ncbi:MAG: hypothetical protein QOF51_2339 [Chloroflexota bacterium]|jgi:transglutaminase-like putative cysteine protease|nr:hypothetical protein [Chloroflexota bacterium]